jgi:intracellular septation protein
MEKPRLSPGLKLLLDLGPLLLFFVANSRSQLFTLLLKPFLSEALISGEHAGIFVATAVFIPEVLVALAIAYALTRHVALMPVVTAIVVVIFGGLTLQPQNETFIKLKPTPVYLPFTITLLGGLDFKKPLLGMVFDSVFDLTDEGWRKLTLRSGIFLSRCRCSTRSSGNVSTDAWVSFEVFGLLPLTMVLAAAQSPLLQKYAVEETSEK